MIFHEVSIIGTPMNGADIDRNLVKFHENSNIFQKPVDFMENIGYNVDSSFNFHKSIDRHLP